MTNSGRNKTFTILSAIGMILVILGHMNWDILTFWGVFPYYSFHVMIFVFIAGYFYKPENEEHILAFIGHKAKKLMIPYFIWNLIYGIICTIMYKNDFQIGNPLTLKTAAWYLFVDPFIGGHAFMLNAASWFVPALFMLEICNVIARRLLGIVMRKRDITEWLLFILYLLAGCFTVFMAKRGSVYDYYKIPGRLLLMAPVLQLGRLYREKLERFDITPSYILIPLLVGINLWLGHLHGGLAYSAVWVTGFAGTCLTPYITTITGIALWLRISKIIAKFFEGRISRFGLIKFKNRIIDYFGSHTFDVMMHHLMVFMGIKALISVSAKAGLSWAANFDFSLFAQDIYYIYLPGGSKWFYLVYLMAGVIVPLAIAWVIGTVGKKIKITKDVK